jgi:O-antigen ligase
VNNTLQILFNPRVSAAFLFGMVMLFAAVFSTIYPVLTVIISLAAVIVLLFMLKAERSYYLLLLLLHLSSIMFISNILKKANLITLGEVFVLLVFLLWCFSRAANLAAPYPKTPCDLPILLFVGLSLLSFLWSDETIPWIYQFLKLSCGLGAFFLTIIFINNHKILNTVIWFVIIMGVINSILCFASIYTYPDFGYSSLFESKHFALVAIFNDEAIGKRGHAFAHPLTTAYWLNFALILSFGKFMTIHGYKKLALGVLMFLMLTAHMTTLSKTPLLALIAGIIFFFYASKPIRKVFFTTAVVLIVIVIVSFILANITDLENSTRYTYNQMSGYNEYSSTTSRMSWWTASIKKSLEFYGFGVGLGGISKYLTPATTPHSHNVYVNTFGDLGFIGLGLLLLIYFLAGKTYVTALRQCKNEYYRYILLSYISGFVIMLLFILTDYDYTATILWWYMGLGFAIAKLATQAAPADEVGICH